MLRLNLGQQIVLQITAELFQDGSIANSDFQHTTSQLPHVRFLSNSFACDFSPHCAEPFLPGFFCDTSSAEYLIQQAAQRRRTIEGRPLSLSLTVCWSVETQINDPEPVA
tara:strand:+ start:617 stop:946 length:330 start_codon:yes stop_codon:yes gene_type:complete